MWHAAASVFLMWMDDDLSTFKDFKTAQEVQTPSCLRLQADSGKRCRLAILNLLH